MIHRIRRRTGFSQIANTALRDTRLSYCARGILAMVLTHSDGWKTNTSWIRSQTSTEGQVAVANAIKQLQRFGYLLIKQERGSGGKVNGCVWEWTGEPDIPQDEAPHSRILDSGSSASDNPPPSEYQLPEHQEEEDKGAAEAAPLPPEELRSLKAKPHSPTPSSAPAPSPCPWHLQHGVSLPESLRTQNCLNAANLWLRYKRERNSYYKPTGLETMVGVWGREFTSATFPMAVEHSMALNYQGVYARPDDKGKRDSAPKPTYDDPFPGMPVVTMADIIAKFGNGQDCVKWANRMRAAGRMR